MTHEEQRPDGLVVCCARLSPRASGFQLCSPKGWRLYVRKGHRIVGATLLTGSQDQANAYLEGLGVGMRV